MKLECSRNISFAIPCHFNYALLDEITSISNITNTQKKISEIYGCLSHSIVGHGRFPGAVTQIHSLDAIKAFRDIVEAKGLRFNYLLNAPIESSTDNFGVIERHISDVLTIVEPHAVTVSSTLIMHAIRKINPNIDICISTIAGVKSPAALEPFLKYGPTRLIPHHDLGRDFDSLAKLKCFADSYAIELQLLVNESCIYGCTRRSEHYAALAKGKNDDEFQSLCNAKKYDNPAALLSSGWIRPEDIDWFSSNFGIRNYKISGREKPVDWLPEVVRAYVTGIYDGNLIRLFAITPPWTNNPADELYLDNRYLQGFINSLPSDRDERRNEYCEEWANHLRQSGKMIVKSMRGEVDMFTATMS